MKKSLLFCGILISVIAMLLSACQSSTTETPTTTLKFSTSTASQAGPTIWIQSWIEKIETATEGKVKIELYPDSALGPAGDHYDMASSGRVDIALCLMGLSPGRFPMSEIISLPGMVPNAVLGSRSYMGLYLKEKTVQDEMPDVKVLVLFTGDAKYIHTTNKPINTLEDMAGLRLRSTDENLARTLQLLGATPVLMPPGETYDSLSRGILDGVCTEFTGVTDYTMQEILKYTTKVATNSAAIAVVMNLDKWNSLSPDIREAIDSVSLDVAAKSEGEFMMNNNKNAEKVCIDAGMQVIELSDSEYQRFTSAWAGQYDEWTQKWEEKGKPAEAMLDSYRQILAQFMNE